MYWALMLSIFLDAMGSPINRLAEVTTIILCTCFPMMPRLVKLISDRRVKSKSYSTPPVGQAWKRKFAILGQDDDSSGTGGAGLHAIERTTRIKSPYERLGKAATVASGSSGRVSETEDVELAMPTLDARRFSDLLEQRLDIGFTIPEFSYP